LFARFLISSGTHITEYAGDSVKSGSMLLVQTHMTAVEGLVIDGLKEPVHGRGMASFAQHADVGSENAKLVGIGGIVVLVATSPIQPGHEVTINYGSIGVVN
jgi:hypothetical protein